MYPIVQSYHSIAWIKSTVQGNAYSEEIAGFYTGGTEYLHIIFPVPPTRKLFHPVKEKRHPPNNRKVPGIPNMERQLL
jgi:hypothetical protein